ncbi:MAG: general stress protein CsbD [Bacteroidota bacterium]
MILVLQKTNWEEFAIKLRTKYPQLTEKDLQHEDGMEESLLRIIEYKLRLTKKELRKIIEEL